MASRPALNRLQPFRRLSVFLRRRGLRPAAELLALTALGATLFASYLVLVRGQPGEPLLAPPLTALLLVANLIPALFLQVLIGRRLARRRAHRSVVGGHGRLHARLVSLFSVIAAIPVLLLVIFASLLFQYGFDFWYSQKARGIFENANSLAQTYYKEKQQTIVNETEVMAGDIGYNLGLAPLESEAFASSFGFQVFQRNLSEGAILRITRQNGVQSLAIVNPYNRPAQNWVPPEVVQSLLGKGQTVFRDSGNRMEAVTPIPDRKDLFLYASRVDNSAALAQTKRFSLVLKDYNGLLDRFRTLQLQFHATLFFLTLLIVGVAVWVALNVADRLVAPIGELVGAARKVSAGDLSTRVANSRGRDEVGVLGNAFNVMTSRLEEQRRELVDANALLERRRGLIEAVLSGVTAGVIAVDEHRNIRMINEFAASHFGLDVGAGAGRPLGELSIELNDALQAGPSERIIELERGGDKRILAVKSVADAYGHVITFDDITQQLADQRRAAWADVARRVAHEIKNPLTPIQLAAERLRRRFGQGEGEGPATVTRLTDTIIRQVGDLRRMVDEFSSFARMPKPVFSSESLIDICRQAIFLHEVAHPEIRFTFSAAEDLPMVTCDRRQLGQAMTNIIKNGVEAISQKNPVTASEAIAVEVAHPIADQVRIIVSDTGIGLPVERERIVEPYMTTRQSGTGLGLAIVKKIVEEHGGNIGFDDREGGGAVVWIDLPLVAGQAVATDTTDPVEPHHPRNLTRAEHS